MHFCVLHQIFAGEEWKNLADALETWTVGSFVSLCVLLAVVSNLYTRGKTAVITFVYCMHKLSFTCSFTITIAIIPFLLLFSQ